MNLKYLPKHFLKIMVLGFIVLGILQIIILGTFGLKLVGFDLGLFNQSITLIPKVLGYTQPFTILLVLQNDAEMRPTGGFISAVSIIRLTKGKITLENTNNIYDLDAKFDSYRLPPPEPIQKYLTNVFYWHLRDQNLSPDFAKSMQVFYPNYLKTGAQEVDVILAVNTKVLIDVVKILGQITVPGLGKFTANLDKRCNCPQIFYEMELLSVKTNVGDRKAFVGPMLQAILGSFKRINPASYIKFLTLVLDLKQRGHILAYSPNSELQTWLTRLGFSGGVTFPQNKNYLMVVDTNFGGGKSNMWVYYDLKLKTKNTVDGLLHELTLVYKNPQKLFEDPRTKLKLNAIYRSWLRLYVPRQTKLISMTQFDDQEGLSTDLDMDSTVISGFFTLNPYSRRELKVTYLVPDVNVSTLTIIKQLGYKDYKLIIENGMFNKNYLINKHYAEIKL